MTTDSTSPTTTPPSSMTQTAIGTTKTTKRTPRTNVTRSRTAFLSRTRVSPRTRTATRRKPLGTNVASRMNGTQPSMDAMGSQPNKGSATVPNAGTNTLTFSSKPTGKVAPAATASRSLRSATEQRGISTATSLAQPVAVVAEATASLDYSDSHSTDTSTSSKDVAPTASANGLSAMAILGMSALLGVLAIGFVTGFIIIRMRRRRRVMQDSEESSPDTPKLDLAPGHPPFPSAHPSTPMQYSPYDSQQLSLRRDVPPSFNSTGLSHLATVDDPEVRRRSISAAIVATLRRSSRYSSSLASPSSPVSRMQGPYLVPELSVEAPANTSGMVQTGVVINRFEPTADDEIELHSGDSVFIFFQYEDGWMLGRIEGTSVIGFFPASSVNVRRREGGPRGPRSALSTLAGRGTIRKRSASKEDGWMLDYWRSLDNDT
ncbi:hypothetical protein M427DRAFT_50790 [Gonapodya prolifera JEL478]|uniref:SH3 domain-containing protein n=1 Tax=Gonapodya prolifera (strain JEL478) TaxID=1344416 RepID=A0A139B0K4_GONPJ|nr:hypothetical protein M427DRAFT_50790 [Gonapodya prolifera JEL478]|eukprot:KXS22470.1 hypothetical protein M427DRAFT_50790 [Gonapodya prolifera JEL478]